MCGIFGIVGKNGVDPALMDRMGRTLAHRGPDDNGFWIEDDHRLALGHRRLAIVDLTPAGHEPMHSASGRWVITFNGEIYNHADIRKELESEGRVPEGGWRGHSDVETLLEAIDHWGLEATLGRCAGMFAFGLWDRRTRSLSLVRDRFGEKPLYYGWVGQDFVFGSELKAFRAHPSFDNVISRRALSDYTARVCVPAPLSMYERIFKLPPASILVLSGDRAPAPADRPPNVGEGGPLSLSQYWSYRDVVAAGLADPIADERDAKAQLEAALSRAIADQAMADVPVGAFLSGGIDSSTVVALYQRNSSTPVRTFSMGFEDDALNEAPFARAVAKHLGTVHHEQIVTDKDAMEVIPLLPTIYDEPFADASQIPTFMVSRIAREQVTVALTGDGGDELFGGYNRHILAPLLWRRMGWVPASLRRLIAAPLSRFPPSLWDSGAHLVRRHGAFNFGAKVQKGFRVVASAQNIDEVYATFLDDWSMEQRPVRGIEAAPPGLDLNVGRDASAADRMMYCDAVSYLPDDILCKVDRASMAVSLETRVPFLDHRVAATAARIPIDLKIRGMHGKHIVRELLYDMVPRELFQRPKAGFAVPLGSWLRGPLRDWAEDLLGERRLRTEGWFDAPVVRERWEQHLSGRRDSGQAIWAILMFQAWLDRQDSAAALAA
jgi:asparagine synthase (glutamine-hydrolysing)